MRLSLLVIPLALILALAPAQAGHCSTWSTSEDGEDMLIVINPVLGWYHVWDHCQPDCIYSYWAYEETNGIPGLQRGDEVVDDTCHGMIAADTIIF